MSALRRLIALRTERPRFVAASLVVLGMLLAWPLFDVSLRHLKTAGTGYDWVSPFHFNDFGAYAVAIARWYNGEPVYWQRADGGYFGTYLYPPVYLLVFLPWFELGQFGFLQGLPLTEHPADVSGLLFEVFSVGLLWVALQALAREAGLELAWYDRLVALWALVGFQPLLFSVKLGQVSALVAALFCFAYVAMQRGERAQGPVERFASGALTTLAAGIKPYYATAGAHLLRDRDRFAGAIGGLVGIGVLSLLVFGVENHLGYLDVLLWGKGWGEEPLAIYLWHPGYYEPLYAVSQRSTLLATVVRASLVVAVAGLAFLAREADVGRATFALGLSVYPLVAPEAYTQDFVAMLVAALVLVAVEFDRRDGLPWVPVLAVGLLAVHAFGLRLLLYHLPAWLPLASTLKGAAPVLQPGIWGNLSLLGLAMYRVAEPAGLVRIPWGSPVGES
ncbi:hypothetical protein BRD00_00500 [Halobacteriales archaeon QS_8_69_26]|nr:MAG: hypothetical protein BRD00_00500 [Halobacteriales archaeon QS_8_69_26]